MPNILSINADCAQSIEQITHPRWLPGRDSNPQVLSRSINSGVPYHSAHLAKNWCARQGLNLRRSAFQADALPLSYLRTNRRPHLAARSVALNSSGLPRLLGCVWCVPRDSNPQPSGNRPLALPIELHTRLKLAPRTGFEPVTSPVTGDCATGLRQRGMIEL